MCCWHSVLCCCASYCSAAAHRSQSPYATIGLAVVVVAYVFSVFLMAPSSFLRAFLLSVAIVVCRVSFVLLDGDDDDGDDDSWCYFAIG